MACDANINGFSLFGVVVLGWWCYYMNTRQKTPQTSLQVRLIEKHISFSFTPNKKFNWLIQQTKKPRFHTKIYAKDEAFSHTLL